MKRSGSTPRAFVAIAAVVGALYGAAHAAGWREYTSFLSGTAPPGGAAALALGIVYVGLHFASVLGAPTLVLGAALLFGYERWVRGPISRRAP